MTSPLAAVPVAPDGDQARRWLVDELAKPDYQAAQPTLFDRAVKAVLDWFEQLFQVRGAAATPSIAIVVAVALVIVVLLVALLLFGLPRLNRRSRAGTGSLFGEDDGRTAAQMRAAAEAAAARGDWSLAVLERFRAVARALDERTLVAVFPGTTATAFARSASRVVPDEQGELHAAAALFDGVRYAGDAASREDALSIAALDDRLTAARPRLDVPVGA